MRPTSTVTHARPGTPGNFKQQRTNAQVQYIARLQQWESEQLKRARRSLHMRQDSTADLVFRHTWTIGLVLLDLNEIDSIQLAYHTTRAFVATAGSPVINEPTANKKAGPKPPSRLHKSRDGSRMRLTRQRPHGAVR